ncbi:MAG: Ribonuclease VapC11 [Dehalococcoidia bacterium]|nr:Ribonuclease VapC11 [Chloroflexota bacterium]
MPILADSSIWIDYLRSGKVPHADLEPEIVRGEVAICGMILAEVLSGVKSAEEAQLLKSRLLALPYLSEDRDTFVKAASLYSSLRKSGITIPLSDCIISTVAMENQCRLLTSDRHFEAVPRFDG